MKYKLLVSVFKSIVLLYTIALLGLFLFTGCSTQVLITSDSNNGEMVDLLAIGPKNTKEIKGIQLPFKYKIKDNNVPQLIMITSNSSIHDSIWIEAGSRNINDNWAPPAIALTALTLGITTPLLKYMWADVPSQEYYLSHSVPLNNNNSYKHDKLYRENMLFLQFYEELDQNNNKARVIANYLVEQVPSAETHYMRGLAYLKNNDIKKASKDFKEAQKLINKESPKWLVEELSIHLNKIKRYNEINRNQKWASIGRTMLEFGNATLNTYLQINCNPSNLQMNQINSSLLDPRLAMVQVQNQLYNEFQHFKEYNKKTDGSNYSIEEYIALKGAALNNVKSSTTDFNSYESESHNQSPAPNQYVLDCHMCHGLGKCFTCNGSHKYINPLTGKYIECPNCKPDGICSTCGGSGKKQ